MLRCLLPFIFMATLAHAQHHPLLHANDTLPDGRKEPLNPFLGRVAVYNEWFGASGANLTLNFEFQLIKKEIWGLDAGFGLGRVPENWDIQHRFQFPLRVQAQIGRRRSRFIAGGGVTLSIDFDWYEKEWPPPNQCGSICPEAPRYAPFVQLGYRLQLERGFFVGLNAQFFFTNRFGNVAFYNEWTIIPWGGLYFGYRLPSAEQHRLWSDRAFKRRVSRDMGIEVEDDSPPKKRTTQPPPIVVSEAELKRMAEKAEVKMLRNERRAKLDQRLNGRSLFYAEGFGATGYFSVNYDYSLLLGKKQMVAITGRWGVGAPTPRTQGVTMPLALGFRVMKNYRGGGLSVGDVPVFGSGSNKVYGFIQPELQFHTVFGLVFGVHYQLILDSQRVFLRSGQHPSYGGFLLGYRLPKMNKGNAN